VVTGSIMGKVPLPTLASYAAAKHALRGFLGSLRVELRARKSPVTISVVNPGAVDTPLWDHLSAAGPIQVRNPPDLYSPETMARALVAMAIRPRPEFTVGGEARIIELGWAFARPVANGVLTLVSRYYSSGKRPAPAVGLLRGPTGEGRASGGRHGRSQPLGLDPAGRPLPQPRALTCRLAASVCVVSRFWIYTQVAIVVMVLAEPSSRSRSSSSGTACSAPSW
jgi:hypothetical protein